MQAPRLKRDRERVKRRSASVALDWLDGLLRVASALALLLLSAPLFARRFPLLDLAALLHWPAVLTLVASATWLMMRAVNGWWRLFLLTVSLAGLAGQILPLAPPAPRCAEGSQLLRIAWANVRRPADAGPVAAWLRRESPQIVGIGELPPSSTALREALQAQFPFHASCLPNGRCSTLIYAKQPPVLVQPLAKGNPENRKALSALRMRFAVGRKQRALDVFAVHLSRPLQPDRQAAELAAIEAQLDETPATLVLGDFNMAPRMALLKDFAARNGLKITLTDRPTWPALHDEWKLPALWQIDHLLAGSDWAVKAIRVSPDLGSDHFGYVADICPAE